ncbi:hypothetical protein [Actinophytocola sp. NPDC049390]
MTMTIVLVAILAGYFVVAWVADRRRESLARDRDRTPSDNQHEGGSP